VSLGKVGDQVNCYGPASSGPLANLPIDTMKGCSWFGPL